MKWKTIEKIALIFLILGGIVVIPSLFSVYYAESFLFMWFAEETWRGTPVWEHWRLVLYLEAICYLVCVASGLILVIVEAKIKMLKKAKAWEKEDTEKEIKK